MPVDISRFGQSDLICCCMARPRDNVLIPHKELLVPAPFAGASILPNEDTSTFRNVFRVVGMDATWMVMAKDAAQKFEWMQSISKCIQVRPAESSEVECAGSESGCVQLWDSATVACRLTVSATGAVELNSMLLSPAPIDGVRLVVLHRSSLRVMYIWCACYAPFCLVARFR
jgi:hypothetical protein